VSHPILGELRLHRDKLPVGGVLFVVHYAEAGSESAEKPMVLESLAAPTGVAGTGSAGAAEDELELHDLPGSVDHHDVLAGEVGRAA
jgi:hypothetical protein